MAILSNHKHERFAQALAKGKSQAQAYEEAGYTPSEPNASRLTRNDKVTARVAELQERGAIRTEITLADIIAELEQARMTALAADTPQTGAAVAASMGKAKLLGLVVDKLEAKVASRREELSDDELAAIASGRGEGAFEPQGRAH